MNDHDRPVEELRVLNLWTEFLEWLLPTTDMFPKKATVKTFDRITRHPERMNGQPCIRDLRLTVRRVLEAMAALGDPAALQRAYPELEPEDLRQALEYAAANLDEQTVALSVAE